MVIPAIWLNLPSILTNLIILSNIAALVNWYLLLMYFFMVFIFLFWLSNWRLTTYYFNIISMINMFNQIYIFSIFTYLVFVVEWALQFCKVVFQLIHIPSSVNKYVIINISLNVNTYPYICSCLKLVHNQHQLIISMIWNCRINHQHYYIFFWTLQVLGNTFYRFLVHHSWIWHIQFDHDYIRPCA